MQVSEVERGKSDSAGIEISDVYARRPPDYAVYRTPERVLIHFADDQEREQAQRTALARLNPIRGEINGLIDDWRTSKNPARKLKAMRYDRRVGDALILAFEQDVVSAELLLAQIKKDIIEERTSWARFSYLMFASAAAIVIIAIAATIISDLVWAGFPVESWKQWFAAGTGTVGAFFSIAIGIRGRTILTDLRNRDNALDAVLRVVIGAIAATLLVCLMQSKAVTLQIGEAKPDATDYPQWLYWLIIAFIGGFSERLVPDLLGKIATETPNQGLPRTTAPARPSSAAPLPPAAEVVARDQAEDDDACLTDHGVQPNQVTSDSQLPPATGGVAGTRP